MKEIKTCPIHRGNIFFLYEIFFDTFEYFHNFLTFFTVTVSEKIQGYNRKTVSLISRTI